MDVSADATDAKGRRQVILRARVKAAGPGSVGCCEKMMIALLAFDREIRVSAGAKLKKTRCQFCRAPCTFGPTPEYAPPTGAESQSSALFQD